MKVYHLNILDDDQAVKELNDRETGGWNSQPRFARYADITMNADQAQAALAWLIGEYTYVAHVKCGEVDEAWCKTQHLVHAWDQNKGVTAMREGNRSSSVGDIVEDDHDRLWLCKNSGWEQIDPVAMAKRSTLDVLI